MLVLTILDGWGYAAAGPGNAIALARKPVYDRMLREYPNTLIHTSGPFVGLPEGQMGNSEVGHLNLGAGRVVTMDITRLDQAIADGSFARNPVLLTALHHARGGGRQLHLLGLCSDGGVHSHLDHLYAILRLARREGVERVFVHAFTDGRDTPPQSGLGFVEAMEQQMREIGAGAIATVSGRYYAMDRDQRWERIQLALEAMAHAKGPRAESAAAALAASYQRGETDEFVVPTVIAPGGTPVATIRDEDAVVFFNFRADRARQMTRALTRSGGADAKLDAAIPRSEVPARLHYVCMTRYDKTFTLPLVLAPEGLDQILAQVLGERGLRNLRVAETEKYAHVTYFFNGGIESAFPGEERQMVASPKVATYDLKPEMSAAGVAATVVKAIETGPFDLIVANFANADMVGHSGKIAPTVKAVETVDGCLGEIEAALRRRGGAMLLTADHGNAETMIDLRTGGPHTFHTTNPVPLIWVGEPAAGQPRPELCADGSLRDIAPTLLGMLNLPEPPPMTGRDLRILHHG